MKVQNLSGQMAVGPMHSFIQNEAGHLNLVSVATIRSTQSTVYCISPNWLTTAIQ